MNFGRENETVVTRNAIITHRGSQMMPFENPSSERRLVLLEVSTCELNNYVLNVMNVMPRVDQPKSPFFVPLGNLRCADGDK